MTYESFTLTDETKMKILVNALREIAEMVPNAGSLEDQPVGIARKALRVCGDDGESL